MEHVQIAFGVSSDASNLAQMKVVDWPVFDHDEFAAERFFVVLIDVSVAHHVSIFLGKDLFPVVGEVVWFIARRGVDRMKVTLLLLIQSTVTSINR